MGTNAIVFSSRQRPSSEKELLRMILDNAHIHDCAIHGKNVVTLLLTNKQVDLLSSYDAGEEDLEDSHDAEQEDAAWPRANR